MVIIVIRYWNFPLTGLWSIGASGGGRFVWVLLLSTPSPQCVSEQVRVPSLLISKALRRLSRPRTSFAYFRDRIFPCNLPLIAARRRRNAAPKTAFFLAPRPRPRHGIEWPHYVPGPRLRPNSGSPRCGLTASNRLGKAAPGLVANLFWCWWRSWTVLGSKTEGSRTENIKRKLNLRLAYKYYLLLSDFDSF